MKFGKSLSSQIEETIPEWRDKFLSYKDLKKRLNLISAAGAGEEAPPAKRCRSDDDGGCFRGGTASVSKEEEEFVDLLQHELDKFNTFFAEKEEEYIILQRAMQDEVAKVACTESKDELNKIRKQIVDFHGEMVLLQNYSALNYTGLVKILKKYDKRTGGLLRLPFIQKVLQQPFFTTDLLNKLVKECEAMLERLFPNNPPELVGSSLCKANVLPLEEEREYIQSLYMKKTVAALRALKEIRSRSSTVSIFSLPPLQANSFEDKLNKIPVAVVEEVSKS